MEKACCFRRLCFAGRLSRFSLKTREHHVVELLTCYFKVFKVKKLVQDYIISSKKVKSLSVERKIRC